MLSDRLKRKLVLHGTAGLPRRARVAAGRALLGRLELGRASRAKLIIIGHPKSGNTWLRTMLSSLYQTRLGMPTDFTVKTDELARRNPKAPRILATNGYYTYEAVIGEALAIDAPPSPLRKKKIVLLARNPCDIAVSWYNQFTKRQSDAKQELINAFIDNGVKKVLVASPHCYHTFKNEYPEFMVNFEVVHISQFLAELIDQGRLEITGEFKKKVTFHDPCYLGRHNGIYDEPRDVLNKIPGLELVEMPDTRDNSLCCGGGGGRIWAETPKEERFSDLRVAQAREVGAEVLATSCPYCISNFEESALAPEEGGGLEIKDITEVIQEALQESEVTP